MFSLSQLADVTSGLQLAELSGHQFHEKIVSGRWIKIFFPQIFMGCMLKASSHLKCIKTVPL